MNKRILKKEYIVKRAPEYEENGKLVRIIHVHCHIHFIIQIKTLTQHLF